MSVVTTDAVRSVTTEAQDSIWVTQQEAHAFKESIAASADQTVATVDAGARRTVELSDAEYQQAAEALAAARLSTRALINGAVDGALSSLVAERTRRRQEVQAETEFRALSVIEHARGQADQVLREGETRALRSHQLADEVYASYRTHDKAGDVREAVDELAAEAAEQFLAESAQVAGDLNAAAAEMARVWRAEVPTKVESIDAGFAECQGQLEGARGAALAEVDRTCGQLTAELEDTRRSVAPGAAQQVEAVRAQLWEARARAWAAIDAALVQFEVEVAARTSRAEGELAMVAAEQQAAVDQLYQAVGNLFSPDDLRAGIDAAFAVGLASWRAALVQVQSDHRGQLITAEATYSTAAARFRDEALGAIGAELDRGGTGLAAVVGGFERALEETADGCLRSIADVELSATAAMAGIAGNISSTLSQGHDAGIGTLDQTVFNLRASHNGVLYELPGHFRDAAKEAIKPWWRKALEFLVDVVVGAFRALVDVGVWSLQTLANVVWGFVWGEAAFPDAWGAGVVVFVADLAAGVLVYGDVRDVLKWGLINPVLRGQGYSAINFLMLGTSLIGLVPLLGDLFKAGAKQAIKTLVKRLGKELAEHLIKELGEEGAERLLKEIGEEAVERLAREAGEDGFKRLLAELGEQGLIDATKHLGPELLAKLAKGLGEPLLKEALGTFGPEVLKDLGTRLGPELLGDLLRRVGLDGTRQVVERVGAPGLKDLADQLGVDTLQQLASRLGPAGLGDLTAALSAAGVKELAAELTGEGLARLVTAVGADGVKPLVEALGNNGLAAMAAELTPELVGQLARELGPAAMKEVAERLGAAALKELTEGVGAAAVKRIIDDIGMDAASELVQTLGGRGFGQLAKELTPAELKGVVTDLGAEAVADTVREAGVDVYVRMLRQGGAALARRIVLSADIKLIYGRGAVGLSAAADALADLIKKRTAVAATELRRLKQIADTQGIAAARAAAELSPVMSDAGRGNIDLFLRETHPVRVQTYFGRALQWAVEPGLRSAAEARNALFRQRNIINRLEPDILLPLGNGRWAVLDWTSAAKAGKAVQKYGEESVDLIIEIIHTGPG